MTKAQFCITVDTQGDRYISLPYRTKVHLPDRNIEKQSPCVEVELSDLAEVVECYRQWNQQQVNQILSKYF